MEQLPGDHARECEATKANVVRLPSFQTKPLIVAPGRYDYATNG